MGRRSAFGSGRRSGLPFGFVCAMLVAPAIVWFGFIQANRALANVPFSLEFDRAELSVGNLGSVPLGDGSSTVTSINGTINGTNVTVPRAGLNLPSIEIPQPVPIRFAIGANSNATGRYYAETGEFNLSTSLNMSITVSDVDQLIEMLPEGALGDLGPYAGLIGTLVNEITCSLSPLPLNLSTEVGQPFEGVRFADGLEGEGAIAAIWSDLPPFTGGGSGLVKLVNDFVCQLIADQVGVDPNSDIPEVPGALRLSRGLDPAPDPDPEEPIAPPVSLAGPTLTGNPVAGFKLTCGHGEWSGATRVGAVWTRDGEVFDNPNASRGQRRTYVPVQDDAGSEIACSEVGVNQAGRTESPSSESIQIGQSVPVIDLAPVLTTSNATGNQVVDTWQMGWQLRCVPGSYTNPTGNPWIGVTNAWNSAGEPVINLAPSGATRMSYISTVGDLDSEITCRQTATNIFGSTLAVSNATSVIDD